MMPGFPWYPPNSRKQAVTVRVLKGLRLRAALFCLLLIASLSYP
jgi:hypothetical protein